MARDADDGDGAVRRRQLANPPDGLDAVDAGQHHVHQHRVECPLRYSVGSGLAPPDEFGLMTEFAQDGVEHDPAERIVLHAEDPKPRRRLQGRIIVHG